MGRVDVIESEEKFIEFLNINMTEFRKKNGISKIKDEKIKPDLTEKHGGIASSDGEFDRDVNLLINDSNKDKAAINAELRTLQSKLGGTYGGESEPTWRLRGNHAFVIEAKGKRIKLKELKRSLGQGLSIYIKTETLIYFLITINILGSKNTRTIGTYPTMTFSEARKEADKHQTEIKESRKKQKNKTIEKIIKNPLTKKPINEKMPCFRNLADFVCFITKLKSKIKYEVNTNVYLLIWLQLLMPTRVKELLTQDQMVFCKQIPHQWHITVTSNKKNNYAHSTEYLSSATRRNLEKLIFHQENFFEAKSNWGSINQPYRNVLNSEENQEKLISEGIKDIWPYYPVEPNQFKLLFEYLAKKYSNFRPEFITNKVNQKRDGTYWAYNRPLTEALAEWWGEQLERNEFHFDEKQTTYKV